MAEKKYNILKAVSWYTIGNILINGVSFFVLPVFTDLMSTDEYGIYSVYTSYLSIMSTVILLGLSSTIAVARYAKEVVFESYISTIVIIPVVLTMICLVIVNIYIPIFGDILSMNSVLWDCLLVSAATTAVCGIIGARLVIDGRYMLYMAYSCIHVVGNVGISLVLCYTVYETQNVHLARIYGSTAANIISAVFLVVACKIKISVKRINIKYALKWGIPLLFHTVATVVLTQSDRILIRYLDSYSSAGIYAVATTIIAIPMVLQQSFSQAWTPWFYSKLEKKEYDQIKWLNNKYIIIYGVIIAGFMLLAPDVVHLFTDSDYWDCIYSLIPLAISVFAELLYSIPVSIEYFHKKTERIMTATLITVGLNILLDIVFIKLFGYHGAAYATVLSKIILFIMHYYFAKRLDTSEMFNNFIILVCVMILCIINTVILFTLDIFFIRYIILAVVLLPFTWYIMKNKDVLLAKLKER